MMKMMKMMKKMVMRSGRSDKGSLATDLANSKEIDISEYILSNIFALVSRETSHT